MPWARRTASSSALTASSSASITGAENSHAIVSSTVLPYFSSKSFSRAMAASNFGPATSIQISSDSRSISCAVSMNSLEGGRPFSAAAAQCTVIARTIIGGPARATAVFPPVCRRASGCMNRSTRVSRTTSSSSAPATGAWIFRTRWTGGTGRATRAMIRQAEQMRSSTGMRGCLGFFARLLVLPPLRRSRQPPRALAAGLRGRRGLVSPLSASSPGGSAPAVGKSSSVMPSG